MRAVVLLAIVAVICLYFIADAESKDTRDKRFLGEVEAFAKEVYSAVKKGVKKGYKYVPKVVDKTILPKVKNLSINDLVDAGYEALGDGGIVEQLQKGDMEKIYESVRSWVAESTDGEVDFDKIHADIRKKIGDVDIADADLKTLIDTAIEMAEEE